MARKANDPDREFRPAPLPQAPLDERQRLACLRLARSEGIGAVGFREVINRFGGAEEALDALPEIAMEAGRGRSLRIPSKADAERELDAARRLGAVPLFTIEPGYPALLAFLDAPPPLIYARGRLELLNRDGVAVVGSRDASAAGRKFAQLLCRPLSEHGLVVISGLARGIDAAAHEASVSGGTIAVLAGGPDHVYPPEHDRLFAEIVDSGCIVSDRWPGYVPRGKDFPRRNGIISGLSHAVIVVEAARRSGTLVTARLAAEQGRQVFAVPGHPLDPRAEGTNRLLRDGASIVTCAEDVITSLRPALCAPRSFADTGASGFVTDPHEIGRHELKPAEAKPETSPPPHDADDERARVLTALGPMPVEIDVLSQTTGLPIRAIRAALFDLRLIGAVHFHGAQLVSRAIPDVDQN